MVISCLTQTTAPSGHNLPRLEVLQALDSFAIPEHLWPAGLQLLWRQQQHLQMWRTRYQPVAKTLVRQICGLTLAETVDPSKHPLEVWEEKLHYRGTFLITKFDASSGNYRVSATRTSSQQAQYEQLPVMPEVLQAAVFTAGKDEYLDFKLKTTLWNRPWELIVSACMT